MQPVNNSAECIMQFKPEFTKALYKTQVSVVGKYLSGLLFIKTMPDSSTRVLFSNEMGFKFFDFEWNAKGDFTVHYMLEQMNKPGVATSLRKDFELVLMQHLDIPNAKSFQKDSLIYHRFKAEKGYNYYVTNQQCSELVRVEKSSDKKPYSIAVMRNYIQGIPDSINITHTNFNFTITLKRLEQ